MSLPSPDKVRYLLLLFLPVNSRRGPCHPWDAAEILEPLKDATFFVLVPGAGPGIDDDASSSGPILGVAYLGLARASGAPCPRANDYTVMAMGLSDVLGGSSILLLLPLEFEILLAPLVLEEFLFLDRVWGPTPF